MLDLTGILFSSIMMLLVIFRAVQLDVQMPWYRLPKVTTDNSGLRLRPNEDEATRDEAVRPRAAGSRATHTR